jgi:hypothetical protein
MAGKAYHPGSVGLPASVQPLMPPGMTYTLE